MEAKQNSWWGRLNVGLSGGFIYLIFFIPPKCVYLPPCFIS